MSPLSTPTMVERVRSMLSLPRRQLKSLFPTGVPRWIWQIFQVLALVLAAVGAYYAWRKFPEGVRIDPLFLCLAIGIYVVAFCMHIMGWHSLTRIFFDGFGLRTNTEAVAGSNLVKYLPTVAWYIANRSHFYHTRGVAQKLVVIASLSELALMVGSGAVLLVALWLAQTISLLLAVGFALLGCAALIWALARHAGIENPARRWYWLAALFWYGSSWPVGILIMWSIVRSFVSIDLSALAPIADIWLLAGLASYAVSLLLGAFGIAREITLTVLLSQHWPLAASIASAIMVKLLLTLGEIGCSLVILGWFQLWRRCTPPRDLAERERR
ncbi:MAG: hypothetical protein HGA65_02850 [Oscillochloris sp.]|nr:hypothetical protein [Oscillochloris sp.]